VHERPGCSRFLGREVSTVFYFVAMYTLSFFCYVNFHVSAADSCGVLCKTHSKFLEVLLDFILLVMSAITFVASVNILNTGVRTYIYPNDTVSIVQYYTLSTSFETFSRQVRSF
jgi:hypothetical protein